MAPVTEWSLGGKTKRGSFEKWLDGEDLYTADDAVIWSTATGVRGSLVRDADGQLQITLRMSQKGDSWDYPAARSLAAAAIRAIAGEAPVLDASLYGDGDDGLWCVPGLPMAPSRSHSCAATREAIAEDYESVDGFLVCWDEVIEAHGRILAFRGLNDRTEIDFLRTLLKSQWGMARLVRPKRARYRDPEVEPDEEKVYRSGPVTVRPVGVTTSDNILEVTCVPPVGGFINGWEIYNLRALLRGGALEDGSKVSGIRAVFTDRATAVANRRPLLDNGVRVAYMGESGELEFITE
jgi:hypothetical protein